MRLTKGTRVEVLSRKEVVTGAWLCGEIVSGNGHMYTVKCGWSAITEEVIVERVPRKDIRPCPPPVEGAGKWAPGDIVEAFHNLSWKMAIIVEDVGGNVFFVRLLGSPQVFRVHCSYLRVRQSWEDGKWFVIIKGSENSAMSMGKREPITRIKVRIGDDLLFDKEDKNTQKRHVVLPRNLKRLSPSGFSCIEEQEVATKKVRPDEEDGSSRQFSPLRSSPTSEKVDAIFSSHVLWGENGMHSSLRMPADNDSCTSSVGSSSDVLQGNCNLSSCFETCCRNMEDYCTDAESFCGGDYEDDGC